MSSDEEEQYLHGVPLPGADNDYALMICINKVIISWLPKRLATFLQAL